MGNHKDLIVYKKAFELAMKIFEMSKLFPKEERYSLTDQVRRSSRSVCVNLAEGYGKRDYPAHFKAKITDADMENTETQTWIEFAFHCLYISETDYKYCTEQSTEIGKLLYHMKMHPQKYNFKFPTTNSQL
ncbi:four helix bundle protein [Filimonas zeae]|uniref:Four helix bundle protein n=1 Tax=Filimonas zeae TaxID=1737353 RepID=A0A917IWH1_9BACT|nr:four helix bundle protein [Filimonas zeae]MDR6339175.1 four helix bundle protein [Filimonas zeae]GGH64764.1 hypothetical protein GCM10011379_17170 [Filimonas zeae]